MVGVKFTAPEDVKLGGRPAPDLGTTRIHDQNCAEIFPQIDKFPHILKGVYDPKRLRTTAFKSR